MSSVGRVGAQARCLRRVLLLYRIWYNTHRVGIEAKAHEMEAQIQEWLYDGVMALLKGERERAQELLLQVVSNDEQNEYGWLWLSGAVDSVDDQQIALENVLAINPNNPYAKQGLALLAQA